MDEGSRSTSLEQKYRIYANDAGGVAEIDLPEVARKEIHIKVEDHVLKGHGKRLAVSLVDSGRSERKEVYRV